MTHELEHLIPDLMRLARILAPDRASAEDMAQEALLKVWSRLAEGGEISELRPYLMTVLRRNRVTAPTHAELDAERLIQPGNAVMGRATCRDVARALERMPPERAALLRGLAAGNSYRDLALAQGLRPGTVMSRVARARAGLRAELGLNDAAELTALLAELSEP